MVSDSGLHSNVFKALSVRQADLSTVKLANFLPELHTQTDTITSNNSNIEDKEIQHAESLQEQWKRKGRKPPLETWLRNWTGDPCPGPSIDSEPPCGAPRSRWFFIGIGSIVTKSGEARLAVKWLAFRAMSRNYWGSAILTDKFT